MLKLTVVNCGESQRLAEYVYALQKEIYCFAGQYGILIYNVNKINRAEGNFDSLKKTSRLYFPVKKDASVEYWGIVGDLQAYYYRWFEEETDAYIPVPRVPYNKGNLRELVNEWLDNKIETKDSRSSVLEIKYKYIKNDDKDICIVEISLNNSEAYPNPKEIFKNAIVKMDEFFSDVFTSAYITDEPTDILYSFYKNRDYDFDLLDSKILDTGDMFYISQKLEQSSGFERKDDLNQHTACMLSNGTIYIRKRTVDKFEYLNNSDASIFDKIVIPQYRTFNWSDVCHMKFFSISVRDLISVYYDAYSSDPIIMLSYGYSFDELDVFAKERALKFIQGRYYVKELIERQ